MLSLDQAQEALLEGIVPLAMEMVPIADAGGRVLARDVLASRDQPPEAMSSMDGYAVSGAVAAGDTLRVIGEAPAGRLFEGCLEAGATVRVATGGVVPPGADRVLPQEIVKRKGDMALVLEAPAKPDFVRAAAGDFAAGQIVARAGELLTPARLGLVAAANHGCVAVCLRPRVAILASGDELREPGGPLERGQIVNSAAYAVAELAERWGSETVRHPILPDDHELARRQLGESDLGVDVLVPIGGASVGDRDRLRPLFEERGARILFGTVAVQPGKPTWHARFPDGRLVLGLPGNPASAFVCAFLFLRPLLDALSGRSGGARRFVEARLTHDLGAGTAREAFLRARFSFAAGGQMLVTADARQDSGLQTPLAAANALLRRPAHAPPARAGDPADLLLIDELG